MTSYHIVITKPAEGDLQSIADYIAKELRDPAASRHELGKIAEGIEALGRVPMHNILIRDDKLAARGIRKFMVDNYIVFYVISEPPLDIVTIIRILYDRREWFHLL